MRALREQIIPPTINFLPDPELDLDYVPDEARAARLENVLSASFGFGGTNNALILRRTGVMIATTERDQPDRSSHGDRAQGRQDPGEGRDHAGITAGRRSCDRFARSGQPDPSVSGPF